MFLFYGLLFLIDEYQMRFYYKVEAVRNQGSVIEKKNLHKLMTPKAKNPGAHVFKGASPLHQLQAVDCIH